MPRPEPELLGDALRKADRDQEEVRKLTEQIRKAIEGSEGDISDESYQRNNRPRPEVDRPGALAC